MPAAYRLSLAALLYCLITVALTYPLVLRLWSVFPHDPGDPALNTWILWWNARATPLTSTWWNAPAFFPVPGSMSFSENLLGLSLVATPIQWLGGSPLLAYNVVFLLTFPLCALGAHLLALEITKRHDAAFIAGLLFGFAPYRMSHLPHIQVLAAFGMPFALLGLHRYLRDPRPRWLVLFGAAWFLQALCNGYYLLFFSVLIGIWILWFSPPTRKPTTFRAIVVALFVAAVPLLPLLWQYKTFHQQFGFVRDFGTTRHYGADVLSVFSSESALMIWGRLQVYTRAEGQLFPGLTVTLLAIAALWILRHDFSAAQKDDPADRKWRAVRRVLTLLCLVAGLVAVAAWLGGPWQISAFGTSLLSIGNPVKPLTGAIAVGLVLLLTGARVRRAYSTQSVLGFYVIAAFVMWLLSLGPAPTLMGEPLMYRGPYAMLMSLPGFTALRVPARFWMMAVLCLSVVGAIAFHRLGSSVPRWRPILAAAMVLGALSDAWIWKFPVVTVPRVWRTNTCIPPDSAGAVMELPLGTVVPDVGAMYRSISHRHPTINGYSGNFPPHYPALRYALSTREPYVLDVLAAHGLEYVVIDRGHRFEHAFRRFIEAQKGAQLVCAESAHAVYRLERKAMPPRSKPRPVLQVASLFANVNEGTVGLMLDGDVTTRWTTGPQIERMMLEIDLGAVREVTGIELSLGPSPADFARGLRIEASEDQTAWREVWEGGSAGRAVRAALQDPAAIPVEYDLSSVHARYLRLWLTDSDDFFYWSIGELKVLGQ